MPKALALIPIELNASLWPQAILDHMKLRVRERGLKLSDLEQIKQWSYAHPHAHPGEEWYKVFPNFTLVGQGQYPKSVLESRMHAKGRKLAFKSKLLQPIPRSHHEAAAFLRRGSGSSDLEKTLHNAVFVLADRGIPSLVVGGYAVQERGYPRFTQDIDLVVPNVAEARGILSISGFKENQGSSMTVTDRRTKFEVDLLPGGGSVGRGPLTLPMPSEVTKTPNIVDLKTLIEIKLSSYLGNPGSRHKDASDVIELIKANNLSREFALAPQVKAEYVRLWDILDADIKV